VKGDLRFRPDTWEFEPVDGKAQFGMSFDDDGHRFICMNRVHVQHVVMSSKYLHRNPALPFSETVQNVPETMLTEPLPGHGTAAAIFPISHNITTADSHAGTFTAACGVTIYRGTGLPEDYYGNVFACDPTGNLVHRDKLIPVGATFAARRVHGKQEMVASMDDWFRPVFLCLGPDGAIYICDMYRKTIEHPTYLPGEVAKHTDFDAGKDKGRIYRISAKSSAAIQKLPTSGGKTTTELCADLSHPNGWHRDTAHRLLIEKADAKISPLLRECITTPQKSSAAGRILALHLLNFLSVLNEATLSKALSDAEAGVRENALLLAESRLNPSPKLRPQILRLADDPSARVRFQCALTLANLRQEASISALATIASRENADKWTRAAVLNSATGHEVEFARSYTRMLVDGAAPGETGVISMMQDLGRILGAISTSSEWTTSLEALVGRSGEAGWQVAALDGFVQSSKVGNENLRSERINVLERKAREFSLQGPSPLELRQAAVDLVGRLGLDKSDSFILAILASPQPPAVQMASVRAYLAHEESAHAALLLASNRWQHYTPAVRETLVEAMMANPSFSLMLLEAVETQRIPRSAISTVRRRQLQQNRNSQVSARALALFQKFGSDDRMKVFENWKSVLSLKADAPNGREVFHKQCSICHRLDRDGVPVGPDLFGMRNQSKETILLHVIIPEYEIMPSFVNYLVETKSHDSFSGMIAAETPENITLRGALNQEQIIWRTNIATITSSGLSLMPQEMEKNMSRQEMANLLAYLKGE
jgi:putative heme-binding domain-containing protein